MSFFNKARGEQEKPAHRHHASNEIKRILQEEGIRADNDIVNSICSVFPDFKFYECPGKCTTGNPLYMVNPDVALKLCPNCGRPLNSIEVEFPRGSLSNEIRDWIVSMGHFQEGRVEMASNKFKDAIISFGKAIKLRPNFGNAFYNRSEARIATDDFQGAIEDCTAAIQINPDDADAYINRGSAKAQLQDYNGCLADTDKALGLGFKKPVAHFNRGLCLLSLLQFDKAKAAFEACIAADPMDRNANYVRQLIETYFGDTPK